MFPIYLTETGGDENVTVIVVPITIIAIVIIVAMIAIVIAWILYRRKRSSKIMLVFKPEPVYDNVSNVHSSNGSGHAHIVDDYEYQTALSCIDDNRNSAHLDDVYLAHKASDQVGDV